jgi:carbon monoxide dehydrogenase subunit G
VQLTSAIRIGRPAPEVLDALLDPGTVAACMPGSRLIGEVAESTYAGELHLRIGPVQAVYAGTVRLDHADRDAGTATLHASGWERGGQGRADASVTLRVESRGASTRVLISADLMIRGKVAEYAPGAIGDVGQRIVEQFVGNVEQLLTSQAGAWPASMARPASRVDGKLLAASALLLAGGALAAGAVAGVAAWRRSHPHRGHPHRSHPHRSHPHSASSLPSDPPWSFSHEEARHD